MTTFNEFINEEKGKLLFDRENGKMYIVINKETEDYLDKESYVVDEYGHYSVSNEIFCEIIEKFYKRKATVYVGKKIK